MSAESLTSIDPRIIRLFDVLGAPYEPCCKCGGYACPMKRIDGLLYCNEHRRAAAIRSRFRRVLAK